MNLNSDITESVDINNNKTKRIFLTGAIFSIIALAGILLDVIIGNTSSNRFSTGLLNNPIFCFPILTL